MLIISFDAVGDNEFDQLAKYPSVAAFLKQATTVRDVSTVFLSNTYPVHTSVATGVLPAVHGVISNTEPFPQQHPIWNAREDGIRVKTIWQAAAERGIDTAAVLWPVTVSSKSIRYNIPEINAHPTESQLLTSLKSGSKLLQIKMYLRHRSLLNGIKQPNLDAFATACMADILREHKPGLALIHLTVYDTLCHLHGKDSTALQAAFESLDRNLSVLLEAAGNDRDVIIFSDHSQLNVHTILTPNDMLADAGLMLKNGNSYAMGESGCFIECCGGSAFFHAGKLAPDQINKIRDDIEKSEGFRRFLTDEEIRKSGYRHTAFGFCASIGFCYNSHKSKEKANHGYPLDMPDYKVFYAVRMSAQDSRPSFGHKNSLHSESTERVGSGNLPQERVGCGDSPPSLLDIAPLVARRLGLNLSN